MAEVILVIPADRDGAALLRTALGLAGLLRSSRVHVLVPAGATVPGEWEGAGRLDGPPQVHVARGDMAEAVEEYGRRADLIVVPRPSPGDDRRVRRAFRTALLRTERPVLVVPPGAPADEGFGRRVAIAWRDDAHTAKAVMSALRYLDAAEAIFLLAGLRHGAARPPVPDFLRERGLPVAIRFLPIEPSGFRERLLEEVRGLGADLLVMGAHVHSPLHRLVYGGMTDFMLAHADLPVLMRH
jgi:nucleotide-binding universal stress UspA family protein